jgi:hypothetical protein
MVSESARTYRTATKLGILLHGVFIKDVMHSQLGVTLSANGLVLTSGAQARTVGHR